MKRSACSLYLLILLHSITFAQQGSLPADSIKQIILDEISISHHADIASANQQRQRASLQEPTDKILEHIPGIQMIRRGNYAWEPTMRSLNAAQVNITIDGMHLFGACTDRMDPISSYIEPTNLKRIVARFGPSMDNYGGAIGGGINFKLQEAALAATQPVTGTIGTGYESNAGALQTLATLQYSQTRFAIQASAILRKASNYTAANQTTIPFSQYQKWNASLQASYQIDAHHQITASYIQDEGKDIGYPALTMDVAYAKAKIGSVSHSYHQHDGRLVHWENKLYYNLVDHAMDDTKRPTEEITMHMDMPGRSWTGGLYSEIHYKVHEKHLIKSRFSGYRNRMTADMTMYPDAGTPMYMYTLPDAQRYFTALDLSDQISLSPKLQLQLMATIAYQGSAIYSEAGKTQLSGMIAGDPGRQNWLFNTHAKASYALSTFWHISVGLAHAMRAASLQEYYSFYIFNRLDSYDYLGNNRLSTEKSINTDLGIRYQSAWLRLEANAFSYFFNDYIAGQILSDHQVMTIGALGVKQYQNIGQAKLYGFEQALQISLHPFWTLSSTNTYTRGLDHRGHALPLIAPFTSTNGLHFQKKDYYAHVESQTAATQRHVNFAQYGEQATPSATIFHLAIQKIFVIRPTLKINLGFRLENVFDKAYYRHQDIMKIQRPGRNFINQLTLIF